MVVAGLDDSPPDGVGLLTGVKVLDVSSFIAAPAAATIMADFGANVIKVEPPVGGDPYRAFVGAPGNPACDVDYAWQIDNRNKRSLALDLASAAGRAVLHRLLVDTDVVIVNTPLQTRAKLGLVYEDLKQLNPALIYASLTAYGESGPEANKSGFDHTALWARTGLMDTIRPAPDAPPSRSAVGMGDHASGMTLFAAIMAALYRRQQTGVGAMVQTNLMANGLWWNAIQAQAMLMGAEYAYRPAREEADNALHNFYRTADQRWFHLVVIPEDKRWPDLAELIGRKDLLSDPRFASAIDRHANAQVLIPILDQAFGAENLSHWQTVLETAGIPFGPVMRLRDIPEDQQMRESDALTPMSGVAGDAALTVNSPLWIDGLAKSPAGPAPQHGEHSREVLLEFGFKSDEIDRLNADGTVK